MGKQARRRGGPSRLRQGSGEARRSAEGAEAAGPLGTDAELVLDAEDASLLDIVDNVLTKGVVLNGDLTISLAHVDLVYARLSLLLCAADRVLPGEPSDFLERRQARRRRAGRRRGAGA